MAYSPAFQFYPADYTIGTKFFTPAERGAYVDCLCHQWHDGSIPGDDMRDLAVVMRCSEDEARQLWVRVSRKFVRGEDGLWRNERLESERKKQAAYREQQAEKGRRSAAAKAQPKANSGSTAVVTVVDSRLQPDANRQVNRTSTLLSSSSSSSSKEQEHALAGSGRKRHNDPFGFRIDASAAWQGSIDGRPFSIPEGWAAKAMNDYRLTEADIAAFGAWLVAKLEAAGGDIDDKGKRLSWLDLRLAEYRETRREARVGQAAIDRADAFIAEQAAIAAEIPKRTPERVRELLRPRPLA